MNGTSFGNAAQSASWALYSSLWLDTYKSLPYSSELNCLLQVSLNQAVFVPFLKLSTALSCACGTDCSEVMGDETRLIIGLTTCVGELMNWRLLGVNNEIVCTIKHAT
jgi:hypothetical protein